MGADVHADAHDHRDSRVDTDTEPEHGPAAGLEATEVGTRGDFNPASGYTHSDNHTVATGDCAASPDAIADTKGRGGCRW